MTLSVPGAVRQINTVLEDLTTVGTVPAGRSFEEDWAGLHAASTPVPSPHSPVPGTQIDGHFPSESRLNTHHGWNRDAQFVIRLPDAWNGRLVVTAAPGIRRQYATDRLISDWMLERGYAYAATDKGNSGPEFYTAGREPGDALAAWDRRTVQLAIAARETVWSHYGTEAERVYATGISNGGYVTRRQIERHPDVYDAGVEWEGPLWCSEGPNLITQLSAVLAHYPEYFESGGDKGHEALLAAGLPPDSEFLWAIHHKYYWELTERIYRAAFEPGGCVEGGSALARVALTGEIGKPLLSLHGTLDCLLPIGLHSDAYTAMIEKAGCGHLHRQYRIEGGNHVDGFCDSLPGRVRPLLPAYKATWVAMENWAERGFAPPSSRTVAWDRELDENAFAW